MAETDRNGEAAITAETGRPPETAITRPAIGVLVDPRKMVAARKSAMLERIELASMSGVSRDEIAKLENGERKRPKVTTLRKLIAAYNKARAHRGKGPIDVEDLQDDGEILIPTGRLYQDILAEEGILGGERELAEDSG